ncbi:hypothetical protein D3C72_1800530 [compost metagenome]
MIPPTNATVPSTTTILRCRRRNQLVRMPRRFGAGSNICRCTPAAVRAFRNPVLSSPQPKPSRLTVVRTPRWAASIRICCSSLPTLSSNRMKVSNRISFCARRRASNTRGKYASPFSSNSTRLLPCQPYSTSTAVGSRVGGAGMCSSVFFSINWLLIARSPPTAGRGRKGATRAGRSALADGWP